MLADIAGRPRRRRPANALLDGFQVAFTWAAILVAFGAVLLLLLIRKRDIEGIDPEAAPVPAA